MAYLNLVVGDEGCRYTILLNSILCDTSASSSYRDWDRLAEELNIGPVMKETLRKDMILERKSLRNVFEEILADWRKRNGSRATLENLLTHFSNIQWINVSDNLKSYYETTLFTDNGDSRIVELGSSEKLNSVPTIWSIVTENKEAWNSIEGIENEEIPLLCDEETIDGLKAGDILPAEFHMSMEGLLSSTNKTKRLNAIQDSLNGLLVHLAVKRFEVKGRILQLLLENRIDFNSVDENERSVIMYAIEANRSLEFVRPFVQLVIDWKRSDREGNNVLHFCTQFGNLPIAKFFLRLDEDRSLLNAANSSGITPIHYAIWRMQSETDEVTNVERFQIFELLVVSGANLRSTDNQSRIAIHEAAKVLTPAGLHRLVELLKAKKRLRYFVIEDKEKLTPIHVALRRVDIEEKTMVLLQEAGVSLKILKPLEPDDMVKIYLRNEKLFQFVLKHFDRVGLNNEGDSIIHRCIKHDVPVSLLKIFLDQDTDSAWINQQNNIHGWTPVHDAVSYFCYQTKNTPEYEASAKKLELLIKYNADITIKDRYGRIPPYLLAIMCGSKTEKFHHLVEFMSDVNGNLMDVFSEITTNNTTMQDIVADLELEDRTLELLYEQGVDFNAKNTQGNSLCDWARSHGRSQHFLETLQKLMNKPRKIVQRGPVP